MTSNVGQHRHVHDDLLTSLLQVADVLLEEGEQDVYDVTREELLRFAAMWAPKQAVPPPPSEAPGATAEAVIDSAPVPPAQSKVL